MAGNDKTLAVWQRGLLRVGTEDVTPATPMGYIGREQGLSLHLPKEVSEYFFDNLDGVGLLKTTVRGARISGTCVQFESAVLDHILGIDDASNIFTIGGSSCVDKRFSVSLTATRRDGLLVVATILHALSVGSLETVVSANGVSELPFEFQGEDDDTDGVCQIEVGANTAVDIATGDLEVGAGDEHVVMGGESDAADTLDTITWTGVATNDIIMLQIESEDQVITLAHDGETAKSLSLVGAVGWVMNKLDDWIRLKYDGNDYVEIERSDVVE